jgi:hypothetical protein
VSIVLYGSEVCRWAKTEKRRIAALETDALRRIMQNIANGANIQRKIKQIIGLKEAIVDEPQKH